MSYNFLCWPLSFFSDKPATTFVQSSQAEGKYTYTLLSSPGLYTKTRLSWISNVQYIAFLLQHHGPGHLCHLHVILLLHLSRDISYATTAILYTSFFVPKVSVTEDIYDTPLYARWAARAQLLCVKQKCSNQLKHRRLKARRHAITRPPSPCTCLPVYIEDALC